MVRCGPRVPSRRTALDLVLILLIAALAASDAAAQAPAFVIMGGDIAYENGVAPSVFLEFLENYSNDLRDGQRLVPLVTCIGNHEVDGGYEKPRTQAPFF